MSPHTRLVPLDAPAERLDHRIPWDCLSRRLANVLRRSFLREYPERANNPFFQLAWFREATVADLYSERGAGEVIVSLALREFSSLVKMSEEELGRPAPEDFTYPLPRGGTSRPCLRPPMASRIVEDLSNWRAVDLAPKLVLLYAPNFPAVAELRAARISTIGDLIERLHATGDELDPFERQLWELAETLSGVALGRSPVELIDLIQTRFEVGAEAWPEVLTERFAIRVDALGAVYPDFDLRMKALDLWASGKRKAEIVETLNVTPGWLAAAIAHWGRALKAQRNLVRKSRAQGAYESRRIEQRQMAADLHEIISAHPGIDIEELAVLSGIESEQIRAVLMPESAKLVRNVTGKRRRDKVYDNIELLAALRAASQYCSPLTAKRYGELCRAGSISGPSAITISVRFGSWVAACNAAGVMHGRVSRPEGSRWTDQELVQIVAEFLLEPSGPGSLAAYREWAAKDRNRPSDALLRFRLGAWSDSTELALQWLEKSWRER